MDDFTFATSRLSAPALTAIAPDFDTLAPNEYADGAYRYRRFSRFDVDRGAGTLRLLPPADFVQSDDINHFQGNVPRHYGDLLPTTWETPAFAELMDAFASLATLPERVRVEVHQIRVLSHAGEVAQTAPEGVHQDGCDRICIVTIDRFNTGGATLGVHTSSDAPALVTLDQAPGEFVVLNDRLLWHSATPIAGTDASRPAHWDCLVLTANLR